MSCPETLPVVHGGGAGAEENRGFVPSHKGEARGVCRRRLRLGDGSGSAGPGTVIADCVVMTMRLTSLASKQTVQMTAKTFTKLLYMARLQGWKPERLPENWPSTSWNTEVILRETDLYRQGLVSKVDARGLGDALQRLAEIEGVAADPELHQGILQFNTVLGSSAFLATERTSGDTVMFTR